VPGPCVRDSQQCVVAIAIECVVTAIGCIIGVGVAADESHAIAVCVCLTVITVSLAWIASDGLWRDMWPCGRGGTVTVITHELASGVVVPHDACCTVPTGLLCGARKRWVVRAVTEPDGQRVCVTVSVTVSVSISRVVAIGRGMCRVR